MTRRERFPVNLPLQMFERIITLVQHRAALPREDLEYVVEKVAALRDERLKQCVAELIGWGDDDRAEIETFIAVAIEVMKKSNPSKIREAARLVEMRYLIKDLEND